MAAVNICSNFGAPQIKDCHCFHCFLIFLQWSDRTRFWKWWEYQITWPSSWEIFMKFRKQQLEFYMEQQTGSKSGKAYVKAVYYHPAYLTYMQSTSWEMRNTWLDEAQARIKIARRNINNLRYADDTTLMAESEEELKASWWKWKRRVKKWN